MKATIDRNGLLLIEPENGLEAFALKKWAESAYVHKHPTATSDEGYWHGKSMMIQLPPFEGQG